MVTATPTALEQRPPKMVYSEVLSFAYETFRTNKVRFALTALGMVIGTASLILVVTIGMTGKQYVLNQIQSIGTNQIEAEYQSGGDASPTSPPTPSPSTTCEPRCGRCLESWRHLRWFH